MKCGRRALCLLLLCWSLAAAAHKPSDSYLSIDVQANDLAVRWDIALRDLDWALGLDADGDGAITWGEVRRRHDAIAAYALGRLTLRADDHDCRLAVVRHAIDTHTDGTYAVLELRGRCARDVDTLEIAYRLLFDADPTHRGLLALRAAGATHTAIFSAERSVQRLRTGPPSAWREFGDYLREGIAHIATGLDHLLFLTALLLPAVLVRTRAGRAPVAAFRPAFWNVAAIVTAFTIAHSITLSLAVLRIVSVPSRWVESLIALSIIVAVADNLVPFLPVRRWVVAFVFGLVHGFGFATVLLDLDLPPGSLAVALAGFNVGVEIGQLALVALLLPLAYALRGRVLYTRYVLQGGSAVIACIAAGWLVERTLDLRFMPF